MLEFSFLKIRECRPLSEMSSCDQNIFDADHLPLAVMFEEEVPLAGLTCSDDTQAGNEREPAVAEAVANLVDDTE